ncbi:bark storage protein A-like [Ipomoea triloba]|uniref:bark storage protein A-like n=1 Tax=Ipomoea triloba TaxID=35885 RepID=UPI00125D491B|nr:bark storage protein A-like [Ipomoea triloba]
MGAKQQGSRASVVLRMLGLMLFVVQVIPSLGIPQQRLRSLSIIRKMNQKGPYIGLVTVYPPEENAFFATGAFQPHPQHPFVDLSGRRFRIGTVMGKKVIYVRCGVGLVNAAATTQLMLDYFHLSGIIHFGIAGNANSSMSIGDVVIPKQFANTGLWDWMKPNGTVPTNDVTQMDFKNYNVPKGGDNELGHLGYSTEQFYSTSGDPTDPERVFWFNVTKDWLNLASSLEGMELEQCLNSSLCLPQKPKLVVGLKGSTANLFLDNAAYREFLFQSFEVTSLDMESEAVVMTSLSNGFPVIAIRGLSDLAGAQTGNNTIDLFGPLAASNTANAVIQFINTLPRSGNTYRYY